MNARHTLAVNDKTIRGHAAKTLGFLIDITFFRQHNMRLPRKISRKAQFFCNNMDSTGSLPTQYNLWHNRASTHTFPSLPAVRAGGSEMVAEILKLRAIPCFLDRVIAQVYCPPHSFVIETAWQHSHVRRDVRRPSSTLASIHRFPGYIPTEV